MTKWSSFNEASEVEPCIRYRGWVNISNTLVYLRQQILSETELVENVQFTSLNIVGHQLLGPKLLNGIFEEQKVYSLKAKAKSIIPFLISK